MSASASGAIIANGGLDEGHARPPRALVAAAVAGAVVVLAANPPDDRSGVQPRRLGRRRAPLSSARRRAASQHGLARRRDIGDDGGHRRLRPPGSSSAPIVPASRIWSVLDGRAARGPAVHRELRLGVAQQRAAGFRRRAASSSPSPIFRSSICRSRRRCAGSTRRSKRRRGRLARAHRDRSRGSSCRSFGRRCSAACCSSPSTR